MRHLGHQIQTIGKFPHQEVPRYAAMLYRVFHLLPSRVAGIVNVAELGVTELSNYGESCYRLLTFRGAPEEGGRPLVAEDCFLASQMLFSPVHFLFQQCRKKEQGERRGPRERGGFGAGATHCGLRLRIADLLDPRPQEPFF